jgi:hypothetical protein
MEPNLSAEEREKDFTEVLKICTAPWSESAETISDTFVFLYARLGLPL